MSDQYYDNEVLNTSVLVEGTVVPLIESAQDYQSDSFLSANDGCNDTQYFSMLDACSNSTILHEISEISDFGGYDSSVCAVNIPPELYSIEGSDDLLAFDVAYDDDGNLQRFRYRLRRNDHGEYEGIPDSFELVTFENEIADGTVVQQDTAAGKVSVKKESMMLEHDIDQSEPVDDDSNGLHVTEDVQCEDGITFGDKHDEGYESCSRIIDSKTGILENPRLLLPINKLESVSHCKVEDLNSLEHYDDTTVHNDSFNTNGDEILDHVSLHTLSNSVSSSMDGEDATLVAQIDNPEVPENNNDTSLDIEQQHIFLTEANVLQDLHDLQNNDHNINSNHNSNSEAENTDVSESDVNHSETEEYEVVEGPHVTGDSETTLNESEPVFEQHQEEPLLPSYILQIPQQIPTVSKKVVKTPLVDYFTSPEKENITTLPQIHLVKTNPRSILKSSYVFIEQNENEIEKPELLKIDKRFLKNKEFLQACLFSNYIAQTKILHAPIRQHRLPRKQTIKPVERNDEEIIVQEVFVSSKGFVETAEDSGIKSKIPVKETEVVHLSDSDDEYKPRKYKSKKKSSLASSKALLKDDKIVISDSNDEEIDPLGNEVTVSKEPFIKKKRGRPPKRINNVSEKPIFPMKKPKPNNSTCVWTATKRWKCENCTKSFPSQGSLKSHMQYHNFQEAAKYKCSCCAETFKNNILLSKHVKTHTAENRYQCGICKKSFTSQTELFNHKRVHVKGMLIAATNVLKYSPKNRTSISPIKNHSLCQFCPKSFSTADLLKAHQKTHMQFQCTNCSLRFGSQLILESHIRTKCVKAPKQKSFIPRFITKLQTSKSSDSNFKKPQASSTAVVNQALSCDSCTDKFSSYASLYTHKVLIHNLETPDKKQIIDESVSSKKAAKVAHSNIPANEKLRNAYASLRSKLDF